MLCFTYQKTLVPRGICPLSALGIPAKAMPPMKKGKTGKKQVLKFSIDCSQPVDDGIMDAASFEKFLLDSTGAVVRRYPRKYSGYQMERCVLMHARILFLSRTFFYFCVSCGLELFSLSPLKNVTSMMSNFPSLKVMPQGSFLKTSMNLMVKRE